MSRRHCRFLAAGVLCCAGMAAQSAAAAVFTYPSAEYATLQEAVDAAAASAEQDNYLHLGAPPIATSAEIVIGGEFSAERQLVIRPDPGLSGVIRTAVVSTGGTQPIFRITHATDVTLQDLDLLRNSTNAAHLVVIDTAERITVERCRIGSSWSSTGAADMSNLYILYPKTVVVRNCILFSRVAGNFATGIYADGFTDPANSLYLYNNDVADYYRYGIHINCTMPAVTIVLRNNVVLNHPGAPVEPVAYRSGVADGVRLLTGGNTAFASPANVESFAMPGALSLAGAMPGLIRLNRPEVAGAFMISTWNATPPWHGNPTFYRLVDGGPLHAGGAIAGLTVRTGEPEPEDIAVTDDWERHLRPGGSPAHTDRGADQIEDGALTGAPEPARRPGSLRVTAAGDGSGGALAYRSEAPGRLVCELFDLAGRRLLREQRDVGAGGVGILGWPRSAASGVLLYRLTLVTEDGGRQQAKGKLVRVR